MAVFAIVAQRQSRDDATRKHLLVSTLSDIAPDHHVADGNPGGFISVADPNTDWTYFVAPGKFGGHQSDKFGGTLSFSLQLTLNGGSLLPAPRAALVGSNGTVLVFDAGATPAEAPDWTSLFVSAEFVSPGVETGGLDGVYLAAPVPWPAAAWSLLSALGLLGVRGARRKYRAADSAA